MSSTRIAVLLTGFEPFDGEPVNPSARLVESLGEDPHAVDGLRLAVTVLPVDRTRFSAALAQALLRHRPAAVLGFGQAAGRARLELETRAVNRLDFGERTDNGGHRARGEPLYRDGPPTLEVMPLLADLVDALAAGGRPFAVSRDAGRHLCNALLYELLHLHRPALAAFVHLPLLPAQAERRARGEPSLPEDVTRSCVLDLLRHLAARLPPGGPPLAAV